jgi:hypothetical protein
MQHIDETTKGLGQKIANDTFEQLNELNRFTHALKAVGHGAMAALGSGKSLGKLKNNRATAYLMNQWEQFTGNGNKPWNAQTIHQFLTKTFNSSIANALASELFKSNSGNTQQTPAAQSVPNTPPPPPAAPQPQATTAQPAQTTATAASQAVPAKPAQTPRNTPARNTTPVQPATGSGQVPPAQSVPNTTPAQNTQPTMSSVRAKLSQEIKGSENHYAIAALMDQYLKMAKNQPDKQVFARAKQDIKNLARNYGKKFPEIASLTDLPESYMQIFIKNILNEDEPTNKAAQLNKKFSSNAYGKQQHKNQLTPLNLNLKLKLKQIKNKNQEQEPEINSNAVYSKDDMYHLFQSISTIMLDKGIMKSDDPKWTKFIRNELGTSNVENNNQQGSSNVGNNQQYKTKSSSSSGIVNKNKLLYNLNGIGADSKVISQIVSMASYETPEKLIDKVLAAGIKLPNGATKAIMNSL